MKKLSLLALPTLMMTAAPPAAHGQTETPFEVKVEHEDINLAARDGVALLDQRIKTIIRRQCATGGLDLAARKLSRQCEQSALANVQHQVDLVVYRARNEGLRRAERKLSTPVKATPNG